MKKILITLLCLCISVGAIAVSKDSIIRTGKVKSIGDDGTIVMSVAQYGKTSEFTFKLGYVKLTSPDAVVWIKRQIAGRSIRQAEDWQIYISGTHINAELLKSGLAEFDDPGKLHISPELRKTLEESQEQAKKAKRGIWKEAKVKD
jgi:hypothetical protein